MSRSIITVLAGAYALCLAPSAHADERFAVTPSGSPEAIFDKTLPETISALGSFCMNRGWSITTSTNNQVTCEVKLSAGQSIVGQLLMGNSYSTPPRQFVLFSASQLGPSTRVQASSWMELQMAFGQTKRNEFTDAGSYNAELGMLGTAGGRLPPGTTFPNHAFMGFDADATQQDGKQALRVKTITEGGPAAKAGLQLGDVIYQIAGKRWKDDASYLDATAKAVATSTYKVQVMRSGKPLDLVFERAYRPTVEAPPVINKPTPTAAAAEGAAPPSGGSIADELSKLADLRARGILTDAEFKLQKSRLLQVP
jgi:hypothetical protein